MISHGRFINHRVECRVLPKLQPQGGSRAEDTDPGMAASVQLEQTSAGHFGGVDSGSDRDTAGHSVCNSGWTSGSGAYTRHERSCERVQTSRRARTTSELKLSLGTNVASYPVKSIAMPRHPGKLINMIRDVAIPTGWMTIVRKVKIKHFRFFACDCFTKDRFEVACSSARI